MSLATLCHITLETEQHLVGWGGLQVERRDLVHSESKEMYSYLFTEAELQSLLLECQRRLHIHGANVRTDSLLTFAAVKLAGEGQCSLPQMDDSVRREREKEASVGGWCR